MTTAVRNEPASHVEFAFHPGTRRVIDVEGIDGYCERYRDSLLRGVKAARDLRFLVEPQR